MSATGEEALKPFVVQVRRWVWMVVRACRAGRGQGRGEKEQGRALLPSTPSPTPRPPRLALTHTHTRPTRPQITGPLIRIIGDRFPWQIKHAILATLGALIA